MTLLTGQQPLLYNQFCSMKRKILLPLLLQIGLAGTAFSQDTWDLRRCVEYAVTNNISIKQADVQAKLSEVSLIQSKRSQYPSLDLSGNLSYSSGRNQDPTTFSLITQGFLTSNYSLQTGVTLFNWFSRQNTIAANQFDLQASRANVDKVKSDISLNVAAAYLQALLNREQVKISAVQVAQTLAQLDNTRKLVAAGSVPELNALELEAQLARDSSTLVTAQATTAQALLQLKAILNMDAGALFVIDTPKVDQIPVESIADLEPETVFGLAIKNMPISRVNDYRVKTWQKNVDASKGALYPTFSLFASLGSRTNNRQYEVTGVIQKPDQVIGSVNVGGTPYNVVAPDFGYTQQKVPYFSQLDQYFNQSIGISVRVPILSGGTLRAQVDRSKLNLKSAELQQQQDNLQLKQDIYKAYTDATASLQKFSAGKKSVESAQRAYDFATKRYTIGLLNTIDLITNQSNLFRAKIDLLLAQYDYVFKLKVLEFYRGQGIKL
jgi:outer membrane protein